MSNIWTFEEDYKLINAIIHWESVNNFKAKCRNTIHLNESTNLNHYCNYLDNRSILAVKNRIKLYIEYALKYIGTTDECINKAVKSFRRDYYIHDVDSNKTDIKSVVNANKEKKPEFVWPKYAEITRRDHNKLIKAESTINGYMIRNLIAPFLSNYDTITLKHNSEERLDIIKVVELLPGKEVFLSKTKYDIIDEHDNVLTTVESSEKLKIIQHI